MEEKFAEAESFSAKATRAEVVNDYDAAFMTYIHAAKSFLHISHTAPPGLLREKSKSSAARCLDRAERIKLAKRDLAPVRKDIFSAESQQYVLDKSSRINHLRFPAWTHFDDSHLGPGPPFHDPDGLSVFSQTQISQITSWKRPSELFPSFCISSASLLPSHIVQGIATDCSVIASLAVCLGHHVRFQSKLGISALYPQDDQGMPCLSPSGRYSVRFLFNGVNRQVDIDDRLPVRNDNRLACASDKTGVHLWPSLVEKAYMKLNGGYDFPGSNSSIDIHALTGWIPEKITIRSASFRREKDWKRISDGFVLGQCLVTVGTAEVAPYGLVPNHGYALTDLREDVGRRTLKVLNPWSDGISAVLGSSSEAGTQGPVSGNGILVLDWDDICDNFDSIYLNWNPAMFTHKQAFHGTWPTTSKAIDTPSNPAQALNHTFRLILEDGPNSISPAENSVWCLLTRHVIDKEDSDTFIALHSFSTGAGHTFENDIRSINKAYSNSPLVLTRISPDKDAKQISLVVSKQGSLDVETRYSLFVYSLGSVRLEDIPERLLHSVTIDDSLSTRTSGGNSSYPTFMNNPQYHFQIKPTPRSNAGVPVRCTAQGSKDVPLNIMVVWSGGARVTDITHGDIALESGPYNYGIAYASGVLPAGRYTLVVSAFEPHMHSTFSLTVECSQRFDLEALPLEGAGMFLKTIKGTWQGRSAAGPSSQGGYAANPTYKLTVPSQTQLQFRLQMVNPLSRPSINVSIFEDTSVTGGDVMMNPPLAHSSGYTDAVSGAITSRQTFGKGRYVVVVSTSRPNVEGSFVLFAYSSAVPVSIHLKE